MVAMALIRAYMAVWVLRDKQGEDLAEAPEVQQAPGHRAVSVVRLEAPVAEAPPPVSQGKPADLERTALMAHQDLQALYRLPVILFPELRAETAPPVHTDVEEAVEEAAADVKTTDWMMWAAAVGAVEAAVMVGKVAQEVVAVGVRLPYSYIIMEQEATL